MRIVPLSTSLRNDEVATIDRLTLTLEERLDDGQKPTRAGTLRALLRFALENRDEFVEQMVAEQHQSVRPPE